MKIWTTLLVIGLWFVPGLVSSAQAQRYPFFVQPISIESLRDLSRELELSREQQAALLPLYTRYQVEFEQLQERDVSELYEVGMTMGRSMWSWRGGNFSIPPRKDFEDIIDLALKIYESFNRIDKDFYDSINTLIIEEQFPALERSRRRRQLSNYIIPHFSLAGRLNDGIRFNLLTWVDRQDLTLEQLQAAYLITDEFERRMLRFVKDMEDDLVKLVGQVLDLIDEMGLREMDMQQIMSLMQEQDLQQMLMNFFDEESKPIQKTIEKMSRLNLQTSQRLKEILKAEEWVQLTFDYADDAYGSESSTVLLGDARFRRAIKLRGVTEEQQELLKIAQADYRGRWLSLFPSLSDALEDQRGYRTSAEFEGDMPGKHDERVDRVAKRAEDLGASADMSIRGILTPEQMALMDGEEEDKPDRRRNNWRARRGESREESNPSGRNYNLPISAMEPVSVDQFSAWLGLQDVDESVLESLYSEYMTAYDTLADEYDRRLTEGYAEVEPDNGWRARRNIRRQVQADLMPRLKEVEDAFFADMSLALPPDTEPQLLEQIRISHDRARRRQKIWDSNWSLRGSTEGTIDIGEIVLAIAPDSLDPETRKLMIAVLIEYNGATMSDIDALESAYESVKNLETRLWGEGESDDMDEELRKLLYNRWESGRSEMSDLAARMAKTNRLTYEGILREMPEEHAASVQYMYERKAFPDVFDDPWLADEQIEATMQIEDLTSEQREAISDLALEYRGEYQQVTSEILEGVRSRQGSDRVWPPTNESMQHYLKMEQLRYRRRQLNDRTRILIELQLTDQQIALVPGLGLENDWSEESDS